MVEPPNLCRNVVFHNCSLVADHIWNCRFCSAPASCSQSMENLTWCECFASHHEQNVSIFGEYKIHQSRARVISSDEILPHPPLRFPIQPAMACRTNFAQSRNARPVNALQSTLRQVRPRCTTLPPAQCSPRCRSSPPSWYWAPRLCLTV